MNATRPDRDAMPYRDCVGIALFNKQGKVFIARRIPEDGVDQSEVAAPWQMPQGGIDAGEEPLPAAYRELYEETSIRTIRLIKEAEDWIYYDLPDDVLGIALKGKYRGQRQKWFAFLFEGDESEIDLDTPGDGDCDPEFDAWRWEALSALPDLIVPFKRDAYLQVVDIFASLPEQLIDG
ncbi:RNA pyrophosphohydrolase [Pelagibacterium xiamenense]|uniref:RNA pyrophosphohydrolase n=1 Tax=Pelagibacterium xiamenense TaxID=2901140 RepID=UPI001E4DCE74|nr:RNA pyrophosphohydrolase [Pelagibacterium xiamenense]MCD7061451.1 RNA pyrophosphohydrolase [Pelagibacterium xiamenense]